MGRDTVSVSIEHDFNKRLEYEYKRAKANNEVDSRSEFIVMLIKSILEPEDRFEKIILLQKEIGHDTLKATLTHIIHEAVEQQLRSDNAP